MRKVNFVKVGNGSPVVWLHGWGCDGTIFAPIAERLPNLCNYLVDLNGFGKTAPPPVSGWSVGDYATELHRFLVNNGLSSVTIVAHSFGCRVATVVAANFPNDVARMLFVAPAGLRRFSLRRWWHVRVYKWKKRLGRLDETHASADWLACDQAMRNTFVKVVNEDLSRYAKRIACPVLIVNGRQDQATPLSHAQKLRKLIKNSSLVEIDGGHFVFFGAPKAFADAVKNFVE